MSNFLTLRGRKLPELYQKIEEEHGFKSEIIYAVNGKEYHRMEKYTDFENTLIMKQIKDFFGDMLYYEIELIQIIEYNNGKIDIIHLTKYIVKNK